MSTEVVDGAPTADAQPRRDPSQYLMCAVVAALGVLVVINTTTVAEGVSTSDVIGPKPVPYVIGGLMILTAVLYAVDVFRGGRGEPESGEDVDLSVRTDWRTVGLLAAIFAGNALLLEWLGWVITSPLLFAGSVWVLGGRRPVLALAVGIVLALATFYGFVVGLGVNLPAGVLQGIL